MACVTKMKEITRTDNGLTGMLKSRLGQFTFGLKFNLYHHGVAFRFLFGHIADSVGILNRFENTKDQCLFIDFDKCELTDIIGYVSYLHGEFGLGDIFIFESSQSHYNLICTDLINKEDLKYIIVTCPFIDKKFLDIFILHGDNTIRITPKFSEKENRVIKLVLMSKGISENLIHRGLALTLKRYLQIPLMNQERLDNSTESDVIFKEYETLQW